MKVALSVPLFLVAALAAGCSTEHERAPAERPPLAVAVGSVEMTDVTSVHEAGGIVRARSTAVIASRVLAPVAAVHVRPGDRVRRGAPLVTLDARENAANHARANAALASSMEGIRAAEADVRSAEAALVLARATHDRIKGLHDKRSATAQELDQAVAALNAADAQLASARARAASAGSARDAARASAEAAGINLSYTAITAPFDAIVTERTVDPGSMALPGAPLLTIENAGGYRLEVQLDEARASQLQAGRAVEVRIDTAAAGSWAPGQIVEIARVDPASHSFLIKVDLPDAPGLRTGLFGRARFPGRSQPALTVSRSALVRRGQLTFVFAVDREGVARLTPVTTGIAAGERIETLAGLRQGDRVVLDPPDSLTDGARVTPAARAAARSGESR